ncbi:hypothetical protein C0993_009598, partial [Termitomyces sp. T159_Od127]
VEGNKPELVTARVHLQEYISNGVVGGIAFENNRKGGVKVVEDGGGGEGFFEEGKYALALAVPVPWSVLSHEPVEGFGDLGVIINEPAVEVGETKEGLHLFYTLGQRPVEDGFHLSSDKTQVVSKGVLMISLALPYGLVVSAPYGLPGAPSKTCK